MVVPLVVWLALQMLETVAPAVATLSVQLVTVAPVFLMVTLWQNPPLHELVVSSDAVTEPELVVEAACSATPGSTVEMSVQAPTSDAETTAHPNIRMVLFISVLPDSLLFAKRVSIRSGVPTILPKQPSHDDTRNPVSTVQWRLRVQSVIQSWAPNNN